MAELDEIVQKVLLQGDSELLTGLNKIGSEGYEALSHLAEAGEAGASGLNILGTLIGIIEGALATATVAMLEFVEAQALAVQKTAFLGEAFGATTAQIQGIEAAFAAAGVGTSTFEQYAQRLTVTIAREWPEITKNIRTAATAHDEAQQHIVGSLLRIKEATTSLANSWADTSARLAADDSRIAAAFTKLQFAAADAFSQMRKDMQSVQSASLSLESAQQRLAALQGRPVSDADQKQLELKEAQLAVDKASQAVADARLQQQKHQAEAAQKQKDQEQALADAQRKRAEDEEKAQLTRLQMENAVKEAVTARAAAEERAAAGAKTDIGNIAEALKGLVSGNTAAAKAIDLTEVSVTNLGKAVIKAASTGSEPTGLQVLIQLSQTLAKDQEHLISSSQRLALVQRLGSQSLRSTGADVFELLHALERGPEYFNKFSEAASHAFSNTHEGVENVKQFKDALEEFSFALQLTKQNLAAAAAPVFTEFLHALQSSLESSTGFLHLFVDGIKLIASSVAGLIIIFQSITGAIDKAFNLEPGRAMQVILGALLLLVAAFSTAWLAIPAAIALIVVALGIVYANLGKVKEIAKAVWEAVTDNAVTRFIERLIGLVKELAGWFSKVAGLFNGSATATPAAAAPGKSSVVPGLTLAGGGEVDGPGTTTSDSIFARLSRGEFVVKAQAVQNYGADLFHQLNNMAFPGFASGGLVPSPVRLAGGGNVSPTSVLNLTLDGNRFEGLRGPKDVVDSLASFAVSRQTTATGRNPSWMG
jgi:hypothetical protein